MIPCYAVAVIAAKRPYLVVNGQGPELFSAKRR